MASEQRKAGPVRGDRADGQGVRQSTPARAARPAGAGAAQRRGARASERAVDRQRLPAPAGAPRRRDGHARSRRHARPLRARRRRGACASGWPCATPRRRSWPRSSAPRATTSATMSRRSGARSCWSGSRGRRRPGRRPPGGGVRRRPHRGRPLDPARRARASAGRASSRPRGRRLLPRPVLRLRARGGSPAQARPAARPAAWRTAGPNGGWRTPSPQRPNQEGAPMTTDRTPARHRRPHRAGQGHVPGGRAAPRARVPLRDRAAAGRAARLPARRPRPHPAPRRSTPSPASATSSTWRRSRPARSCSTSAAARAPTASSPRSPRGRRARHRRRHDRRAARQGHAPRRGGRLRPTSSSAKGTSRSRRSSHGSFDCVISNGVINLSPDKPAVFAAAAPRCGRAGDWRSPTSSPRASSPRASPATPRCGRPASAAPCSATTTWRRSRPPASRSSSWRENDRYRFVSDRADNATQKYGVTSISLLAAAQEEST